MSKHRRGNKEDKKARKPKAVDAATVRPAGAEALPAVPPMAARPEPPRRRGK